MTSQNAMHPKGKQQHQRFCGFWCCVLRGAGGIQPKPRSGFVPRYTDTLCVCVQGGVGLVPRHGLLGDAGPREKQKEQR